MKKTKILSLLLCLSLFCALIVPGTRAYADNEPDSGMKISKTATANADGSYTIMLEAYATGAKVISEITKDVPTDIILVLDQSGSMNDPIGGYTYTAYRTGGYNSRNYHNDEYYPLRHNGGSENLWHKLNNNEYIAVSVEQKMDHTPISGWSNRKYYDNRNSLYCLVSGEYKSVAVKREGHIISADEYWYTVDGQQILYTTGDSSIPNFGQYAPLYQSVKKYTYSYTLNGATTVIKESFGDGSSPDTQFYRRDYSSSAGGSKLNALKSAVTSFVNNVNQKALGADGRYGTADDVAHRIAIVGFASNSRNENTELLSTERATDYWSANAANYRDALVSACGTNGGVNSRLTTAIDRLDASGDTYLEYGMDMANKIFAQYPITAEDTSGRQRVVVVFTDGYPAPYGTNDFKYSMANNAIRNANVSKQTYGATVYTVGEFNTADPTADIETNFATSDGWSDRWGGSRNNLTEQQEAVAANRYMHYVSSNFPGATSLNQGGSMNPNANPFAGGDSYYLSAADSGSLNNIFQQISDQIETGGTSSTLTADAVVKDIISPQFTLPEGATASDITLETYRCTGVDGNGNYTWSNNNSTKGATATIGSTDTADATTTNNQVSVTGFDFAENWVGTETSAEGTTTYRGNKLVIKFNVTPRPGFFGGNGVDTNTSAGVYENKDATDPVLTFPKPDVNVPLAEPTVNVPDANVYLGAYYSQTVPEDAVKMGATVTIAGYPIDFSKADDLDHPYGLEPWQVKYVNISISAATTGNGGSFENIQEDISYTVTVTVSPKTPGTSGDQSTTDTGEGTIHVFKPQLTYQDSQVWYGGDVPTDFTGNLTEETWINSDGSKKHDDEGVQMLNEKPTLTLSYTPEAGKIADGKVNTKQDIAVDVTVKIGETDVTGHTTFVHTKCADDNTCTDPANGKFLLHIQTCTLNITKQGGAADESYVFDVFKDGVKYSEVTVWGNGTETLVELPIGTYTISENAGWSWRYTANNGSSAELTAQNPTGSITCGNTKNNNQWLNGFSEVVRNIFDTNH